MKSYYKNNQYTLNDWISWYNSPKSYAKLAIELQRDVNYVKARANIGMAIPASYIEAVINGELVTCGDRVRDVMCRGAILRANNPNNIKPQLFPKSIEDLPFIAIDTPDVHKDKFPISNTRGPYKPRSKPESVVVKPVLELVKPVVVEPIKPKAKVSIEEQAQLTKKGKHAGKPAQLFTTTRLLGDELQASKYAHIDPTPKNYVVYEKHCGEWQLQARYTPCNELVAQPKE